MSDPKKKLTFESKHGLGKLKLRFADGALQLRLAKQRAGYELTREQAQELALWLSTWSLKLIEIETKGEAETEEAEARQKASESGKEKKDKPKESKVKSEQKRRKSKKRDRRDPVVVAALEQPKAVIDGQAAN